MNFLLATSLYLLTVNLISCSITTQYYQRLINQGTKEALEYKLPTSNNEFKQGVESENTEGKQIQEMQLILFVFQNMANSIS